MTTYTTHDPPATAVSVRDIEDGEDGSYRITAPISSDQQARDGEALSREKLKSFRSDIVGGEQPVPLMIDHGRSDFGGDSRYSVLGRAGTVDSAELTRDGDTTLLKAEMSVADPDALAEEGDTGEIEEALRYIKFQAENFGLSFSIGWSDESARTGEPSIYEVSAVAVPSDVAASTAGVGPTEAATRGFEALPSRDTSPPEDWGLRAVDLDDQTDAERAEEALEKLDHVREFHTPDDDVPHYRRPDSTPPVLATIDEILRLYGYAKTDDIDERLEVLRGDQTHEVSQREDALEQLDAVEGAVNELAAPNQRATAQTTLIQYPFGRSRQDSREQVSDAVETLRDLVDNSDAGDFYGLAGFAERGGL